MTDNESIKAYVNCIGVHQPTDCQECPYHHEEDGCYEKMTDDILSLINRQKAEIEGLNEYISRCKSGEEYWVKCLLERPNEAIKEFAERLKEKQKQINITYNLDYDVVFVSEIDNLVKEMVGDKNENESQTG
jgi:hypothetical protein